MASDTEPVLKKVKKSTDLEEKIDKYLSELRSSSNNLVPVLNDDFDKPMDVVKVFIGYVKEMKNMSRTILALNAKVPLKELQHLKRVRKNGVLICPVDSIDGKDIETFIRDTVPEIENVFERFEESDVPANPPLVRRRFEIANKLWSCNFHPDNYLEKLVSGDVFDENELNKHRTFMEIVFETAKYFANDKDFDEINSTVVVDPKTESIVAIAFDYRKENPLKHSAMLAIDNVAKTQNGGSWIADKKNEDIAYRGINENLLKYLKIKYTDVNFGAREYLRKSDENDGPYLCTGYYVYSIKEPCLMCSMALVHARAKRIFFCLDNVKFGGLKSVAKLQTISSLNHRFEVFTGFL